MLNVITDHQGPNYRKGDQIKPFLKLKLPILTTHPNLATFITHSLPHSPNPHRWIRSPPVPQPPVGGRRSPVLPPGGRWRNCAASAAPCRVGRVPASWSAGAGRRCRTCGRISSETARRIGPDWEEREGEGQSRRNEKLEC